MLIIIVYLNSDSRILIGSVSRHTLCELLDDHMAGVNKHAQTIRDHQSHLKSDTETEEQERPQSPSAKLGESFSKRMSSGECMSE